jgi:hypothetical protein
LVEASLGKQIQKLWLVDTVIDLLQFHTLGSASAAPWLCANLLLKAQLIILGPGKSRSTKMEKKKLVHQLETPFSTVSWYDLNTLSSTISGAGILIQVDAGRR